MGNASNKVSFGSMKLLLNEIQTPFGLLIREATLSCNQASVQVDPFVMPSALTGLFEARLRFADLEKFIALKAEGALAEPAITSEHGELVVTGKVSMIVTLPMKAVCRLRIEDERQIFVDLSSVEVTGLGVKNLVQSQLNRINPVFDAKDLPLPVRLTEVTVENEILIRGTVSPPQ